MYHFFGFVSAPRREMTRCHADLAIDPCLLPMGSNACPQGARRAPYELAAA